MVFIVKIILILLLVMGALLGFGVIIWFHTSEYLRRRHLTKEQREIEDREISERLKRDFLE